MHTTAEPHIAELLQIELQRRSLYKGKIDCDWGAASETAYKQYISSLEVSRAVPSSSPSSFGAKFVALALREVGTKEVGNNGGARIREYQSATWLEPGSWAWCAAFICWLIRELIGSGESFSRPRTAGAWDFENWARDNAGKGVRLLKPRPDDILPGDIVIFTFSHIGLAVGKSANGTIATVEGNTDGDGSNEGDGVYRKTRKISQIRSVIRFV